MLLGHWIEMRSVMGASEAVEELVKLIPSKAHRLKEDGGTEEVPVSELKAGDRVLVKPGEKIPTDGVTAEGRSSVNEAMLTGDSEAVAQWAARKLELDDIFAEVLPAQKASMIREVKVRGLTVWLGMVLMMLRPLWRPTWVSP
jgi:Cu2+-exporting ATPase